jgi:aldehyde dehydrogenase (NAD+)
MFAYQTYIDGKWVDAASGKTFQTFDPYTGEPWATVPECDKVDVDRASRSANRGGQQKHWIKVKNRKHPAYERLKESFS